MASRDAQPLLWLDMEMTGLDPETCVPIEIAIVVTDAELTELDVAHAVIHQPEEQLATMIEVVREMHTANGLLDKVRAATTSLAQADALVAEVVARQFSRPAVLAGNSIHTDRRFVMRYFPQLEARLHYRMVDVSSFKEVVRRWYGEAALYPKPESDHTAVADARASIAELAFYRKTFMVPVEA
ncbi:MAG TPA: oligoribonuclease [Kofleriaceae bacterium]|nr:oligoribonuclease [Kofleriaceae bacterium]